MNRLLSRFATFCFLLALTACGGTKVLKEPDSFVATQPLVTASDQTLSVALDWVIVRDGPGTWAKNSDWDEYLLRVRNQSGSYFYFLARARYFLPLMGRSLS